ncbi:Protein of unknown function [Gryllus bimaculatus]|nr:Protein of unknown function [Gryllus bimaculatus]
MRSVCSAFLLYCQLFHYVLIIVFIHLNFQFVHECFVINLNVFISFVFISLKLLPNLFIIALTQNIGPMLCINFALKTEQLHVLYIIYCLFCVCNVHWQALALETRANIVIFGVDVVFKTTV